MSVAIRAKGCANPVSVEGLFERPARSWALDQRDAIEQNGVKGPTEAEIVLSDAKVSQIRAGFAEGEPLEGLFEASTVSGEGVVFSNVREAFVHNHLKKILNVPTPKGQPAIGAAVLKAPAWPYVKVPLHFFIKADLMHLDGYHRCYIDVPALFGSGGGLENGAFRRAFAFTTRATPEHPLAPHGIGEVPGFPDIDELAKAEVTVLVSGHTVDGRSVGSGATTIPNGVRYSCSSAATNPPAKTNVTCAGTPVFEQPGTEATTTRDVFFAGIVGALAATLLIEAAFIGNTESPSSWIKRARRSRS